MTDWTRDFAVEIMTAAEIGHALPSGAVHQGLALRAPLLDPTDLETLASPASGVILMLDQVIRSPECRVDFPQRGRVRRPGGSSSRIVMHRP